MNQLARYIIIIAVITISGFVAWYFSSIVAYILIAAVVSIIGKPLVHTLDKVRIKQHHLPRALSAAVALLAVWLIFATFFFFLVPTGVSLANQLGSLNIQQTITDMGHLMDNVEAWLIKYIPGINGDFSLEESITGELTKLFGYSDMINVFGSLTSTVVGFLMGAFAVSFISFFFLKEEDLFTQGVLLLFPARHEQNALKAMESVNRLLTRYFIGIFCDMFCVLTLVTLGVTFIAGLPFKTAIALGLIAGILNVIPYIGLIVSTTVGSAMGMLIGVNAGAEAGPMLLSMLTSYVVAYSIDAALLQPFIYSKSVRSHPLEIFIVLLLAGSIGGIVGMLIAIPSYTVLRVFAKQFFNQFRVVQKLTQRM